MDRFNNLYRDFLSYLLKNFPSYEKYINIEENPDKRYLYNFVELNLPYMEDISTRNADIFRFKYVDVQLIKGLKLKRIIDRIDKKMVSSKVLESIWRQLHSLYIIAYNSCDLKKIVKKNFSHHSDLTRIIDSHNIIVENIMLSGHAIIEETSSDYSDSESEDEDVDEEEEQLKIDFEKMLRDGKTEVPSNDDKDVDSEETQEQVQGQVGMEKMFEGSLIGNLAKELSEEIDPKDLGDIKNPSDIFSTLFNQEQSSESGLGNIVNTVVKKLDNKMKNGELNQEQLFSEAQNMMSNSNLFGPLQQMGAMTGMNMMGNQGKKNKKNKKKNNRRRR